MNLQPNNTINGHLSPKPLKPIGTETHYENGKLTITQLHTSDMSLAGLHPKAGFYSSQADAEHALKLITAGEKVQAVALVENTPGGYEYPFGFHTSPAQEKLKNQVTYSAIPLVTKWEQHGTALADVVVHESKFHLEGKHPAEIGAFWFNYPGGTVLSVIDGDIVVGAGG